jgi:hypothetical protein
MDLAGGDLDALGGHGGGRWWSGVRGVVWLLVRVGVRAVRAIDNRAAFAPVGNLKPICTGDRRSETARNRELLKLT